MSLLNEEKLDNKLDLGLQKEENRKDFERTIVNEMVSEIAKNLNTNTETVLTLLKDNKQDFKDKVMPLIDALTSQASRFELDLQKYNNDFDKCYTITTNFLRNIVKQEIITTTTELLIKPSKDIDGNINIEVSQPTLQQIKSIPSNYLVNKIFNKLDDIAFNDVLHTFIPTDISYKELKNNLKSLKINLDPIASEERRLQNNLSIANLACMTTSQLHRLWEGALDRSSSSLNLKSDIPDELLSKFEERNKNTTIFKDIDDLNVDFATAFISLSNEERQANNELFSKPNSFISDIVDDLSDLRDKTIRDIANYEYNLNKTLSKDEFNVIFTKSYIANIEKFFDNIANELKSNDIKRFFDRASTMYMQKLNSNLEYQDSLFKMVSLSSNSSASVSSEFADAINQRLYSSIADLGTKSNAFFEKIYNNYKDTDLRKQFELKDLQAKYSGDILKANNDPFNFIYDDLGIHIIQNSNHSFEMQLINPFDIIENKNTPLLVSYKLDLNPSSAGQIDDNRESYVLSTDSPLSAIDLTTNQNIELSEQQKIMYLNLLNFQLERMLNLQKSEKGA